MHNLVIFRTSLLWKIIKNWKSKFQFIFQFRAEVKKVTSRAKLKILQLKLWLKPAWLGLITINQVLSKIKESNCIKMATLGKYGSYSEMVTYLIKWEWSFKIFFESLWWKLVLRLSVRNHYVRSFRKTLNMHCAMWSRHGWTLMSEQSFPLPSCSELHTTALELNTFWNRWVAKFICIYIHTMGKKLMRFQKERGCVVFLQQGPFFQCDQRKQWRCKSVVYAKRRIEVCDSRRQHTDYPNQWN